MTIKPVNTNAGRAPIAAPKAPPANAAMIKYSQLFSWMASLGVGT
jgi:hypothetical protein